MKSAKSKRVWEISQQANEHKVYTCALLARLENVKYQRSKRPKYRKDFKDGKTYL